MSFAATELQGYPTRKVCQLLNIPRSSVYHKRRHGGRRAAYKEEEKRVVYEAYLEHHGSFGRRMLKRILEKQGIVMSERKVSRIMKELGIQAKYGRKRCRNIYTCKDKEKYIHENLFAQLTEQERKHLNIWSMDFTEEKIQGKTIYTCGIISVNSKILVGYLQSEKCNTELALATVRKAIEQYGTPDMLLTDRGIQFTNKRFSDTMESLSITHSMSRPHTPIDNRFIETFWKSMKVELGKTDLLTKETYRMVIDYYIYYYNNLRPHSALDYCAPLVA